MWTIGLYVVALIVVAITTHWTYKWRNPKCCRGKLPPGSMGFPLVGETIQFFVPSNSLDIPPFVKNRTKKYGPIFKTSLAGRPVVVSTDADFNHFILQQEGKLVELWYMDSFGKLLGQSGPGDESSATSTGEIYKNLKKSVGDCLGPEILKQLIPELCNMADQTLASWSEQHSLEVKHECAKMTLNFTSRHLFGYDPEKSGVNLSEMFASITQGLMSFPLNIPGTAFHRCMQMRNKIFKIIRDSIEERRRASPDSRRGDFLGRLMDDMESRSLLTDEIITYAIFALLLATYETIPSTLTVAIMLLGEHPLVVQELMNENDKIIEERRNAATSLTWKEYKSMTLTMQVLNETLRISSSAAGILRKTTKDIQLNGYIIPEGWTIFILPSAIHLNPDLYQNPLSFNPWRWKDSGVTAGAKSFIPFGGGQRSCSGSEFSKVFMATFLHVLVTKYSWKKVKGGEIARSPTLSFGNGYYIRVSKKTK
ncbi:hypothetical protein Tsubulata_043142 [Turnera subulata]|uniref:Cytochrome P450 n=1 Tax=Turnera subulata TaxID=218843 RepID=A0A9Q0JQX7_9ROSI|nr:hypothetical protein Tsubulata_043142 [Turnera subulata]